jgi:hypothetical protein
MSMLPCADSWYVLTVLSVRQQQPDLGTLLLGFFQQFGTSFDTRKHMVR